MQITEPKKVPETCLAACLRGISALRGSLCFPLSRSSIRRAANSRPYDADRSVCARRGRRLGGPSFASPFGASQCPAAGGGYRGAVRSAAAPMAGRRKAGPGSAMRQGGKSAQCRSTGRRGLAVDRQRPNRAWCKDAHPLRLGARGGRAEPAPPEGEPRDGRPQGRSCCPPLLFKQGRRAAKLPRVTPPCRGRCAQARQPCSTGSSSAALPRCGCGGSSPDAAAGSARRGWRESPPRPTSP